MTVATPTPTRVLFLEVDAGDKVLVRRWAEAGILPTFRRLLADGLVGDSASVDAFFVGATWPSLYTGVNPARHGIHSLIQLRPGTYEFYRCYTGENLKREPFWNLLSRAGRRVAILDVPLSAIAKDINGIQSVEWGSHDANYGFRAWPPAFESDLRDRFGEYPLQQSCNGYGRSPQDIRCVPRSAGAGRAHQGRSDAALSAPGRLGLFCPGVHGKSLRRVTSAGTSMTLSIRRTIPPWWRSPAIRCATCMWRSTRPSGRFWSASGRTPRWWCSSDTAWRTSSAPSFCFRKYWLDWASPGCTSPESRRRVGWTTA